MFPKMSATADGARIYERALRAAAGSDVDVTTALQGADLCVARYESPPYDLIVAPIDASRLSINLSAAAVRGGIRGERERDFAGRRHSLFLTPARSDVHWRRIEWSRHITIYFHRRSFDEAAGASRGAEVFDRPMTDARRPDLRPWIDALELAIVRDDPFAAEATLGLARLILASLLHRPGKGAAGLPPQIIARTRDYIATHLDSPLRVSDLAVAAGMTPSHFAHAFTTTTGCTPHRYVRERRLACAMQMLQHTRVELAEVAATCGFSSQQHLNATFRRFAGTTPGQVRRDAKPNIPILGNIGRSA